MKKLLLAAAGSSIVLAFGAVPAFAHVTVSPDQVGVAKFQTFDLSVPSESSSSTTATVAVRLVMPNGLKEITPTIAPGWTVTTKKDGDMVTEINWTAGSIPTEMRNDFTFQAQVPSSATTLKWKAYQTYKDGTVVSWDQDPATIKSGEEGTPYSTTSVINDIQQSQDTRNALQRLFDNATTLWVLSTAALGVALLAVLMQLHRKPGDPGV